MMGKVELKQKTHSEESITERKVRVKILEDSECCSCIANCFSVVSKEKLALNAFVLLSNRPLSPFTKTGIPWTYMSPIQPSTKKEPENQMKNFI